MFYCNGRGKLAAHVGRSWQLALPALVWGVLVAVSVTPESVAARTRAGDSRGKAQMAPSVAYSSAAASQPGTSITTRGLSTLLTFVDWNGDAYADFLRYRPSTGEWATMIRTPGTIVTGKTGLWSAGWTIVPANFTGVGFRDLFFYNPETGAWYQGFGDGAGDFTYRGGWWSPGWNVTVLDLNGDGRSDVFVYNPESGIWYQCLTAADTFVYSSGRWSPGWRTFAAKLDSDAHTDVFVYSPETGAWFRCINDTRGGFRYEGTTIATDQPIPPGLFNRWSPGWDLYPAEFSHPPDGLTDFLAYDAATGYWYVCMNTGSGFTYTGGQWSAGWTVSLQERGPFATDLFLYNTTSGAAYDCFSDGTGGFTYSNRSVEPGMEVFFTYFEPALGTFPLHYSPATGLWQAWPSPFSNLIVGDWGPGWEILVR